MTAAGDIVRRPSDLSPAWFENYLQYLDEGFAFVDTETNEFTWVNDYYADLLRSSPDTMVGETWIKYTPKPYDKRDLQLVQEVIDGKRDHYRLSKLYIDEWRQEVPVTIDVHAVRNKDRNLVAFLVRCKPATDVISEGLRRVEEQIAGMKKRQGIGTSNGTAEQDRQIGAIVRKHGLKALGLVLAFLGSAFGAVYAISQSMN